MWLCNKIWRINFERKKKEEDFILCISGTEEVADHALTHILNLYRKFSVAIKNVENNVQTNTANTVTQKLCKGTTRIRGQKLGLIGFGRIGMAVARRASVFGFQVGFYDPYVGDGFCKSLGVER